MFPALICRTSRGSPVRGGWPLMSPGVAHGPDPVANVYATLGAGDSVLIGDPSQGRLADTLHTVGVRTALIGNADSDDTGPYRPALLLLPTPDLVFDPTVPAPTSPGGRRTDPARLWTQTQTALHDADLVIVHFGDFARLERENQDNDLMPSAYVAHRQRALAALDQFVGLVRLHPAPNSTLLLVVPTPPLNAQGRWDRLTPFFAAGPGFTPADAATLTSDTTQTPGLVAARDLAPTVLGILRFPAPLQMTGAPVHAAGPVVLGRLDRQTRLNQDAQDPLFWGIGLLAPALILPCLAFYLMGRMTRGTTACRLALYTMRLLAAWPLALLLAPLLLPGTLPVYLGLIAALTGLLACLPSPAALFSLTALVLIGDGLTGTTLVSQSVLSSYALAGIRFYGIGNEYMGLLLGGALLAAATTQMTPPSETPPSGQAHSPPPPPGPPVRAVEEAQPIVTGPSPFPMGDGVPKAGWGLLVWFALVTVVLSCPAFGAKAGGAVTAAATFTLAWLRLRGVRLRLRHLLAGLAAGFALVFLWALLGDALHLRRTHLATAVGALEGGRFGYILGVSVRKVGLAVRVFLHPGTLLGLLALAIIGVAARTVLWPQVAEYYRTHPRLAAVSEAGLWGCGVCVLFNDSGIVAAILLLMCLILPVLHGLFQRSCASWPSTSAMSESASPSPTL